MPALCCVTTARQLVTQTFLSLTPCIYYLLFAASTSGPAVVEVFDLTKVVPVNLLKGK